MRFSGRFVLLLALVSSAPLCAVGVRAEPFSAVAAGDMTANSAVIWTQLRNGIGDTQTAGTATPLTLEIARDASFSVPALSLSGVTVPENGNTLKLLASGLASNTQYFYRFRNGSTYSDTGTFFTTPTSRQIAPFKIGFTGDYDAIYRPYTPLNGFGTPANPGSMGLRYFINLGDLIYERNAKGSPALPGLSPSSTAIQNQNALNEFYRKYIENVSGVNPDGLMNISSGQQSTRQLLLSTGVYSLLDNHELYNAMISGGAPQNSRKENYLCGDTTPGFVPGPGEPCLTSASNNGPNATFINKTLTQNTMAKAFYNTQATAAQISGLPTSGYTFSNLIEATPTIVAPNDPRTNGTPQNFFSREWGGAARYIQLDDRSYRDARMLNTTPLIADDPNRTMLGMTQLDWFKSQLSKAQQDGVVWKVVSVSTPIDVWLTPENTLDNKSWIAGYNAERNEIMKYIETNKISNVVFLTTDDHIARATRLTYQPAGAAGSNPWTSMSSAFQLLAGPGGAIGPYENYLEYGTTNPKGGGVVTTGFNIETTEKLLNAKNPEVQKNGGLPVGLMGLPGLNNVYREQDPAAAVNPTSKDFASATTYGYTTLAWDRFANLSVEYLGVDAYRGDTFPQPTDPARLLFGFTVDVPYTVKPGEVVTLTDADRHQFTGRNPDPLYYNAKWTNQGALDLSQTSSGARFASYEGDGVLVVGANTPLKTNEKADIKGGTLIANISDNAAYLAKTPWTVVRADGGISGAFDRFMLSTSLAFLTPTLSYSATEATLSFALTPFGVAAQNRNQLNVANGLTAGVFGPMSAAGANVLNTLFYGGPAFAPALFNTVSGAGLVGAEVTAMNVGSMVTSTITDQIAFWRSGATNDVNGMTLYEGGSDAPQGANKTTTSVNAGQSRLSSAVPLTRTYRAWGSVFAGAANIDANATMGTPSLNNNFYGGLLGVDYQIDPRTLIGVAIGGSSANFNANTASTSGSLTGFHLGLYGAYTVNSSYLALSETFSAYSNQTTRKAGGFGTLSQETLSANFGATEWRTRAEAGHEFTVGGMKVTPFAALEFAAYSNGSFSETSNLGTQSSLALGNNGQTGYSLPLFIGMRLAHNFTFDNGWRLGLVGSVAYVHEFFPNPEFSNYLIGLPAGNFTVIGPRAGDNLLQAKLGAQLNINKSTAFFASFQGEFASNATAYGGTAGFKYTW